MEIKNLIEGNSLNANTVKIATTKTAIILSGGAMKEMQDKSQKFCLLVEFNGRQLNYTPNKVSLQNIAQKYGYETQTWIGKTISLSTQMMSNGKEGVIANP